MTYSIGVISLIKTSDDCYLYSLSPLKPRMVLASFTSRSFPMKFLRFSMEMALRASHWVDISTKANPLGWPVCLSFTILTDTTSPALEKRALTSDSLVSEGRFATYIFLLTLIFLFIFLPATSLYPFSFSPVYVSEEKWFNKKPTKKLFRVLCGPKNRCLKRLSATYFRTNFTSTKTEKQVRKRLDSHREFNGESRPPWNIVSDTDISIMVSNDGIDNGEP